MATPGWYPDPGGAPGRFRYWDGSTWSADTSPTPGGPAGSTPTSATAPSTNPDRRRRLGPWIAVVAVVVVLAVVLAAVGLGLGRRGPTVTNPVPASATPGGDRSQANDASPSEVPEPTPSEVPNPTSTPVPLPSPSASQARPSAVTCPPGDPGARQDHPNDGRIHGGGISIPTPSGWTPQGVQTEGFTWAYDVGEAERQLSTDEVTAYAVGALSVADGFDGPQAAAELSMACTLGSGFYGTSATRSDLRSTRTAVDGNPAWTLQSRVTITSGPGQGSSDIVWITVVDLGSPEALSFFWGSAPVGDGRLLARLSATAAQIQVD